MGESGAETSTRRVARRIASARPPAKIPSPTPQPQVVSLPKPLALPHTVAGEAGFVGSSPALRTPPQNHTGLSFHTPLSPTRLSRYSSAPMLPALRNVGREPVVLKSLGKVRPQTPTDLSPCSPT